MVDKLKRFISGSYLAFIVLFLYAPILVLMVLSFNSSRSRVVWGGFTFKWYQSLFENEQIMQALLTTLFIAFAAAIIATVIGVAAAVGMNAMQQKSYKLTMMFTNIPMLNADVVTGIALMLWMVNFIPLGFGSVLISHITFCIPYVILSVMPKIRQMNMSVYEAARDLGANVIYAFFKVMLPQIMGGIVAGFFMAFTMSMDDFVITYFTKGAGVETLSTMIYGEIRKGIKPELYALSTIIFVIIFLILLVVNCLPDKNKKSEEKKF